MLNGYFCYLSESVLFRLIASFRGHLSRFVRHNGRRSHDLGGLAIRPDKASKMPVEEKELSLKGKKNIHCI